MARKGAWNRLQTCILIHYRHQMRITKVSTGVFLFDSDITWEEPIGLPDAARSLPWCTSSSASSRVAQAASTEAPCARTCLSTCYSNERLRTRTSSWGSLLLSLFAYTLRHSWASLSSSRDFSEQLRKSIAFRAISVIGEEDYVRWDMGGGVVAECSNHDVSSCLLQE